MKKLLFILCFVFTMVGYAQNKSVKANVVKYEKITTAIRDSYVVPSDEVWHIELIDGTKQTNNGGAGWVNDTGGGSVSFTDITGNPEDNTALGVALGSYLPLSGGTMTGNISMGYNNISNLADLSVSNHITTPTITKEDTRFIPKDALPSNSEGWVYWDDSENRLKAHDGTSWKAFLLDGDAIGSAELPTGTTAERPSSPDQWDRFIDTDLKQTIMWDGSSWVDPLGLDNAGGGSSEGGGGGVGTDDQNAAEVPFDDTSVSFTAANVQEAIEELDASIGAGGSTNYGLRKTVEKTANFTLSTEDARISSGGDIYKKPRITVNDGNSYTATLGNIGAVDDYFFFAVDNSGSELIVEPSSVDISLNGTTVTGNIKLSNDGEGFLYKTAASKFKAKGEWQLEAPTVLNLFPTGNAASPDGDESNATTGWSEVDATLSSDSDAQNGSYAIKAVATNNNGNDRVQITITGLDAAKTYMLDYYAKASGVSGYVQILSAELDGSQYLQAIGGTYTNHTSTINPNSSSITILVHANLSNSAGEIGDFILFDNAFLTEL